MDKHQRDSEKAERAILVKDINSKKIQKWLADEFMIQAYNMTLDADMGYNVSITDAATLVQAAVALNPTLKVK
ncbi:MAG TPA: hypothetical protein VIG74_03710 [Alphaproteobacteria bacterium]